MPTIRIRKTLALGDNPLQIDAFGVGEINRTLTIYDQYLEIYVDMVQYLVPDVSDQQISQPLLYLDPSYPVMVYATYDDITTFYRPIEPYIGAVGMSVVFPGQLEYAMVRSNIPH